jgi:valyl-tRNA synthetase
MDEFDYSQTMKEIEYFLWHELADHYIEMAKSSIYKNENFDSITYTLNTIGLGILKLFAPFFPHITEEIYQICYNINDRENSIHISSWPEPEFVDEEAEKSGEIVKNYIAKVRSIKSEQGIALNAPLEINATFGPANKISILDANKNIINLTLNLLEGHKFLAGKPEIEEKIIKVEPVHSKIGPIFKNQAKLLNKWIDENQDFIIKSIKKSGDITWEDIPVDYSNNKNEKLIENKYLRVLKKSQVKGEVDKGIIQFDDLYLEVPLDMVK